MTISYSGNFIKLLFRWKGSIWRSVWKELVIYIVFFYGVRTYYTIGIDLMSESTESAEKTKQTFEALCRRFDGYCRLIPLTFLLGFYVSNVVGRWWRQFECLPWPEDFLTLLCAVIQKSDEQSFKRRHVIARYLNLSTVLAWRDISSKIRLRFPNVSNLIAAGLLTHQEFQALENIQESCNTLRWMTPLYWIQQILLREEAENKPNASMVNNLLAELKSYRGNLRKLFAYDWVSVPLVYTQVAALATYAFFFFALFGRQTILSDVQSGKDLEMPVPIFLIVQFLFFVGWFKVGQDLMRPFGLDDDDIELNYILDRNITTSFAIISKLHMTPPPDFEDENLLWKARDQKLESLPHTRASLKIAEHRPKLHSYVKVGENRNEETSSGCFKTTKIKRHIDW